MEVYSFFFLKKKMENLAHKLHICIPPKGAKIISFRTDLQPCTFFYDKKDLGIHEKYKKYGNRTIKRLILHGYEFGCYRKTIKKKQHPVIEYRCLGKDKKENKCYAKIQEKKDDGKVIIIRPLEFQNRKKKIQPKRIPNSNGGSGSFFGSSYCFNGGIVTSKTNFQNQTTYSLKPIINPNLLPQNPLGIIIPPIHYPNYSYYPKNVLKPKLKWIERKQKNKNIIIIRSLRSSNSTLLIKREEICELGIESNFKVNLENVKVYLNNIQVKLISVLDMDFIKENKKSYLNKNVNHILCFVTPDFKKDMSLDVNIIWSSIENNHSFKILEEHKKNIAQFKHIINGKRKRDNNEENKNKRRKLGLSMEMLLN